MPKILRLLVATMLAVSIDVAAPSNVSALDADCGGMVFRDLDADGERVEALERDGDADDLERPARGIDVVVVDVHGATHRTSTSAAGRWQVTLDEADYPIRIEFDVPRGHAAGLPGPDGGTVVQYAAGPGACDGGPTGNLGITPIDDFCASQPLLAVVCHVPTGHPGSDAEPAIRTVRNDALDNGSGRADHISEWLHPEPGAVATVGEIGTVYGLATDAEGTVFAAAFTKRHTQLVTPLNPDGNPTAIYRIPAGGEPELFTVIDPTAEDPHRGDRHDQAAMDDVFTTGLGDLELSPDGSTLYVVDLGRRELVAVDAADGRTRRRVPLDGSALDRADCGVSAAAPSGDLRAFGLAWHGETLLVGIVCSAATTVVPGIAVGEQGSAGPGAGDHGRLDAHVYGYRDGRFSRHLSWPLAADRGDTQSNGMRSNDAMWHPWVDSYPFDDEHEAVSYPQPVISDLVIDARGDLVVALADRWSHQTAPGTVAPAFDGGTRRITETIAAGDLQRACRRGSDWIIEGSPGCQGGFGNGWEFFDGDSYGWHAETALGSVARLPGRTEVVATHMNPRVGDDTWRSGGLVWHGTDDGERLVGVRLYDGRHADPDHTFEQAAGLGDLAVLCGGPPRGVGGALWHDVDADGMRDVAEPPLVGVAVELRAPDGEALVVDVTDELGRYGFDEMNVRRGLVDGVEYEIALSDRNYDLEYGSLAGSGEYSGLVPTISDVGGRDDLDSDASSREGRPVIVHRFDGADGERVWAIDHTRDIGLRDRYDLAVDSSPGMRMGDEGVVAFEIEVRNEGSVPSGAYELRADLPAQTSMRETGVPPSVETSIDDTSVTWSFAAPQGLDPGEARTIEMVLQVNDPTLAFLEHGVELIADSGDDEDSSPGNGIDAHRDDDADRTRVELFGIDGTVWQDLVGARSDRVHSGVDGVVVYLIDARGRRVGGSTTDDDGRFLFDALPAGSYRVGLPASEFEPGQPLDGAANASGADTSDVAAALDRDGMVMSTDIVLGSDIGPGESASAELWLERRPPRPLIDVVVVVVLVPLTLLCMAWLLVDRRRQLGVVLARAARAR